MTDAVRTTGLVKKFRRGPVTLARRTFIDDLSLSIPAGGITGLLGPNGAGKSTVLRILLGLARPDAGTASVLGHDVVRDAAAARECVAFAPERRLVFGWMRVSEFLSGIAALSKRWDAAYAERLANRWRIPATARIDTLEPTAHSRLLLLTALARRAELLVVDEPTAGLDPAGTDDVLGELAAATADGATVLLATHRLDEVERICDRVVVLRGGKAVLQESMDTLHANWRVIDLAGPFTAEQLLTWEEVVTVVPYGEHRRLIVRRSPDAVADRVRMLGGEVLNVRPLALREIYLTLTGTDRPDDPRDPLA